MRLILSLIFAIIGDNVLANVAATCWQLLKLEVAISCFCSLHIMQSVGNFGMQNRVCEIKISAILLIINILLRATIHSCHIQAVEHKAKNYLPDA